MIVTTKPPQFVLRLFLSDPNMSRAEPCTSPQVTLSCPDMLQLDWWSKWFVRTNRLRPTRHWPESQTGGHKPIIHLTNEAHSWHTDTVLHKHSLNPARILWDVLTLNTVEPTDSDASPRKTTWPSNFSARREKDNWACQPISFLNKHGPSDSRVEASTADICSSLNTIQMRSSVPTPVRCIRLIEPMWGPISVDVSGAEIVWQLLLVQISIYSLHSMITESGLRILELFSLFI